MIAGYAVIGATAVDMVGIRLLTNGVGDSSFGIFGEVAAQIGSPGCLGNALAIQPDGKILIAGYSANGSAVDFALVRYTTNGAPDASFNGNGQVVTSISLGQDLGMAVGLQRDGKIIMAGSANILGHPQYVAVRYNTNGSLDAAYGLNGFGFVDFGDGGDNNLNALAIDSAGRVIVAGQAAGLLRHRPAPGRPAPRDLLLEPCAQRTRRFERNRLSGRHSHYPRLPDPKRRFQPHRPGHHRRCRPLAIPRYPNHGSSLPLLPAFTALARSGKRYEDTLLVIFNSVDVPTLVFETVLWP